MCDTLFNILTLKKVTEKMMEFVDLEITDDIENWINKNTQKSRAQRLSNGTSHVNFNSNRVKRDVLNMSMARIFFIHFYHFFR